MNIENISSKITRFGYIIRKDIIDDKRLIELRKDLTVMPAKFGNYGKFQKDDSYPLYIENGDYISIPKYFGLETFGKPQLNKIEMYRFPKYKMEYKGILRPNQTIIVNKVFDTFEKQRGGIIVAGCGSGKTNMAIYIACKYQLKTLFVVHKEFLMNQAIDRIKSTTNIKKVGIIQQNKVETDFPFVVGMIQSLSKKNYNDIIFRDFGLIIFDEVHHMASRVFSNFLKKNTSKYMLGISAERDRKDGLYKVINWYLGPIIHAEEQKPNDMVVVKKYFFRTSNKKRIKVIKDSFDNNNNPKMINNLVKIKFRNRLIIKIIEELFDQGKNILFLSERKAHVIFLYNILNENKYIKNNIGFYLGGMKAADLSSSSKKQIIMGTFQMAEEGLDIENLNVVILSTPKSSIKQSVGRILRKEVYEEHPIVIDIVDEDNSCFMNRSYNRTRYFKEREYNIQSFYFSDYQLTGYQMWNDVTKIKESLSKLPAKNKSIKVAPRIEMNLEDIDFVD